MKQKKQRDRRQSGSVIVILCAFSALFVGMIGYLVRFVAENGQELINNSYNSRQEILLSQNYRGTIFSADGEVLAQTKVLIDGTQIREYPFGEKFAHVVGFSSPGRTGVEAQANYYLINSGVPLSEKIANDVAGRKNPGDNVYTTLHADVQEAAYKALDTYKGAVIVTEVSTGKVIAMVSKPDFDPNEIAAIWDDLIADKNSSVLVNRAAQGLYPPGSTFKIVTALSYIRENPESWQDYRFQCRGYYKNGDDRIKCIYGINHGSVDFVTSFAKSCNSSFANIGLSLDRDAFAGVLDGLLFNRELPVKFNYAKSSAVIDDTLTTNDMMQTSIGQGKTLVTPLHMNMITAAIGNGGIMMTPYVVDRVENVYGSPVKSFRPSVYGRVMSEEEARILSEMMAEVIKSGTAAQFSNSSYTVAGKTGSAEFGTVKGESHAWFTGFAPADEPQICVTLIIEGAGNGGEYAVPMARRVFDAWFDNP